MPKPTVSERLKSRASHAEKYWTKSRMRKATPIPIRVAPSEMVETRRPETNGKTRVVAPVLPGSASRMLADTSEVSDMTQYPVSCVGKLFMREGSSDYVGSAWVIGDRAIFTAAHCIFDDNGTFFDDVVFQPQYRNGSSLGAVAVVQMAIDPRYFISSNNTDLRYDLGIAILNRSVSQDTGVAGYVVNPTSQIALGQTVTGVGYPAGPPFDGSKMFKSQGRVVRDDASGTTQERYFGAENDMTGGCSGGPWFDRSNIAVGLNSFVFRGERPPIMHSPFFGQGFADLVEWAEDNGANEREPGDGDKRENNSDDELIREQLIDVAGRMTSLADELVKA